MKCTIKFVTKVLLLNFLVYDFLNILSFFSFVLCISLYVFVCACLSVSCARILCWSKYIFMTVDTWFYNLFIFTRFSNSGFYITWKKYPVIQQCVNFLAIVFNPVNEDLCRVYWKKSKHYQCCCLVGRSSLHEKCPYSELFWSAFSRIRTEYGEIRSISLYSVRMRENADQNSSEYGHFLRSSFLFAVVACIPCRRCQM